MFEEDCNTEVVLMIGEIGGKAERKRFLVQAKYVKPVLWRFIAEHPPLRTDDGYAGAIISGRQGDANV
jgi:succinyl-CoA synthetase alpha subunit